MKSKTDPEARNYLMRDRQGIGTAGVLVLVISLVVAVVIGLGLAVWLTGGELPLAGSSGGQQENQMKEPRYAYVTFGPTLVNLAEGRLTRYLKVSIALQVRQKSARTVKDIVSGSRKAVFRNWLIIQLSDLKLEDVKGSSSVDRLRNEILTGFNRLLSRYCEARVEDVLFEEFNVQ